MTLFGLISAIGAVLGATISSVTNGVSTKQTNEANKQIAQEANAAQAAESEKAYRRSMPINQVANLRNAGMSHAGALNVLSGGGSYTPAPVNTAQMQSFSMDNPLAGASDIIAGIGTNTAQMKQNKAQFDEQMRVQEEQFNASHSEQQRVNDASIAKSNAETAQINYQTSMSKLQNNEDEYIAYGRLSARLNPADYDTAYSYISALKDGDDGEYINHPNVREQLENQWYLANSGKLTTSQTGKTIEDTKSVKSARDIAERMSVLDDMLKRSQLTTQELQNDLLEKEFDRSDEIWKFTSKEMQHKTEMWTHELSKLKAEADEAKANARLAEIQKEIQNEMKASNINVAKLRNELESMNLQFHIGSRNDSVTGLFYNTLWYITDGLGINASSFIKAL